MIYHYIREVKYITHPVTCHLSVHVGGLGRVCHQPNLFNELHKTVHEKKLGLRSHSREVRFPPECPALMPHERVNLIDYA